MQSVTAKPLKMTDLLQLFQNILLGIFILFVVWCLAKFKNINDEL